MVEAKQLVISNLEQTEKFLADNEITFNVYNIHPSLTSLYRL